MPLYDFRCECGFSAQSIPQRITSPHTMKCPCGLEMKQDYSNYRLTIMGDLPTTGYLKGGYFDDQLDAHIDSTGQRKELMKKKGLRDFEMGSEQAHMHKETEYIAKHAPEKDIRREVGKVANEFDTKFKEKQADTYAKEHIDPVVDAMVAQLD